jgi:hypothetical protein
VIENRQAVRHNKCFFRGFVYFGGNLTAVDCVVRDISDSGARLQFAQPPTLTSTLDLNIPIKGRNFHARVCWHDGCEIGVAFQARAATEAADMTLDKRVGRIEVEIAGLRQLVKQMLNRAAEETVTAE